MPRAMWTGAISFGMVSVPVKLYSALNRKTVRFHQLSGKSGVRIAQKRVDPQSGEEVPYEDIVKGFEIAPDRYVVIEPGELEALQPKKTKTIEIEEFVELSEIDPIFYDHPYYLAPGPGGAKPYRLLLEAMRETGKVAIARVVIRSKEQLVAMRPIGDVLGMATMMFADEVLPPERLDELADAAEVKTTKRELDIAKQLVDSLAGDFEPRQVPRHLPRGGARADRAQGAGRGDRRAAGARGGRGAGARPDERAEGEPRRGARARRRRRAAPRKPPRAKPRQEGRRAKKARREEARGPAHRRQAVGARPPRKAGAGAERPAAGATGPNATSPLTPEPAPARRRVRARTRAALRHPRAPRPPPALGSAPGARRRARLAGRSRRACRRRPSDNHFAAHTEDHPLEYLDFEGEIPEGPVRRGHDDDLGSRHLRVPEVGAAQGRGGAARRARRRPLRAVRDRATASSRRTG